VFDNVAKVSNVEYMQERGVYVVGLTCSDETKIERLLKQEDKMDASDAQLLREQISNTEQVLETGACVEHANTVYNTEQLPADYAPVLPNLFQKI
ncbi:MAG: hypothetical protein ABEI52_00445, partial [Halobacteriaceae archaeon]